jgi:hypothetical protein
MKKFLFNIIKIVAPFAIIMVLMNYFVDTANIFSNGLYESRAADIVLKGHNISNLTNCDERLFLEKVITRIPYKPDVVIIGTSRSLEISSDFFPKKTVLNCSVSHASMNDFIAIIGLLDSTNKLPKEIYIESSPTLINPSPTNEWFSLYNYFNYAVSKIKLSSDVSIVNSQRGILLKQMKTLFSFQYFQTCLTTLLAQRKKHVIDVEMAIPTSFGRMKDCSVVYDSAYSKVDTLKEMADAAIFVSKNPIPLVDAKYLKILQQIVGYLKAKQIAVTLVNIPFQQDCYKIAEQKNKTLKEIKKGIEDFAIENQIKLIGTLNPFEANLNRGQFYDPLHCNKVALERVLNIVQYNPNKEEKPTLSFP